MTAADTFGVRRLVVAVDSAGTRAGTFARAADVAARLGAELAAVLVEDERLLQAAASPLARYVSPFGAAGALGDALEGELRAFVSRTRAALAAAAAHAGVAWSLDVRRGDPLAVICGLIGPGDLVVLAPGAEMAGHALRFGAVLCDAIGALASPVLLTRGRRATTRPLVIADPGSALVRRQLVAAMQLGRRGRTDLDVIVIGDAADAIERMIGELDNSHRVHARVRAIIRPGPRDVARLAAASGSDLLILASDAPSLAGQSAEALMDLSGCEVLVIR